MRTWVNAMLKSLQWVAPVVLLGASVMAGAEPAPVKERSAGAGPPFQRILDTEHTARLLAILLDSGRYVINENQDLFDNAELEDKGFTPEVFERQLIEMFRSRSGIDLRDLQSARLPQGSNGLLQTMVTVSKQVVADAQPQINRKNVGFKGFIPAVFGARVADRYAKATGVRLKQTALAPRNPANAPDAFEKAVLRDFADPAYPREKVISEATADGGPLRLMFPLYTTRRCLDCHGEPKGELDITGYPREGLKLGQNAGAISVVIPVQK